MFYTADILSIRKNGKLARVWLAATLSERLFKQSVSKKVLSSINITATCNEILKILNMTTSHKSMRFSLYLSAQLMYGTVKLYSYQIANFEVYLLNVQKELQPLDLRRNRKRKRTSDSEEPIDLPEPPPLREVWKDLHLRTDLHLMPEADLETIRQGRARIHVQSPTFGVLTDEQVEWFLTEDDWHSQRPFVPGIAGLNESVTYAADDLNERPNSPRQPIDQQNFGTIDDSTVDNLRESTLQKTPKKRESKITNVDTPTKRRRRHLVIELEEAAEQRAEDPEIIPPVDFHADQPIDSPTDYPTDQPTERPTDIPADQPTDVPADIPENRPDITVPESNDLHLDSLEPESVLRPRTKRTRRPHVDEDTMLSDDVLNRRRANVSAYTVSKESMIITAQRRRGIVPGKILLAVPSTISQTTSEDWRRNGTRYVHWAAKLRTVFDNCTRGPFSAEDDHSMSVEAIRAADSRVQQMPEDISSGLGRALEGSSRNKTADELSTAEALNPQLLDITENHDYQPPITDIDFRNTTNEPNLENIGDVNTMSITNQLESNVVEPNTTAANERSTLDPDTGDIDAFLPPKMRTRDVETRASLHSLSSAAIVEILNSPISTRSEMSLRSEWTNKVELMRCLEINWRNYGDSSPFTLAMLLPTETTSRLDVGACFVLLLGMHKDRIVNLKQSECYADIYIYKAVMPDSSE